MKTDSPTYADTLDAAHALEAHFRATGTPHHSGLTQNWWLEIEGYKACMSIYPNSSVPRYLVNGLNVAPAGVYAVFCQI